MTHQEAVQLKPGDRVELRVAGKSHGAGTVERIHFWWVDYDVGTPMLNPLPPEKHHLRGNIGIRWDFDPGPLGSVEGRGLNDGLETWHIAPNFDHFRQYLFRTHCPNNRPNWENSDWFKLWLKLANNS